MENAGTTSLRWDRSTKKKICFYFLSLMVWGVPFFFLVLTTRVTFSLSLQVIELGVEKYRTCQNVKVPCTIHIWGVKGCLRWD